MVFYFLIHCPRNRGLVVDQTCNQCHRRRVRKIVTAQEASSSQFFVVFFSFCQPSGHTTLFRRGVLVVTMLRRRQLNINVLSTLFCRRYTDVTKLTLFDVESRLIFLTSIDDKNQRCFNIATRYWFTPLTKTVTDLTFTKMGDNKTLEAGVIRLGISGLILFI